MTRITYSDQGETLFQQLLGHNEQILQQWTRLEETFTHSSSLSAELKEQVRRTLAFGNGCEYCQAKGEPNLRHAHWRTSVAVAFAQLFLTDHLAISDAQFHVLKETFSEKEISELCAFICFTTGAQLFGAILQLKHPQTSGLFHQVSDIIGHNPDLS